MSKHTDTVARVVEKCTRLQDTLDSWVDVGRDLNELACSWIEERNSESGNSTMRLRKTDGKKPQGLRKRCIAYLETLVGATGFGRNEINNALQIYALEQSAGWVGQLKSEAKARHLKPLARWHWEGCKLTREGNASIKAIHEALCSVCAGFSADLSAVTSKDVKDIVASVLNKPTKKQDLARKAAKAFFDAVEGTDRQGPADRKSVVAWLAVLLRESPIALDLLSEAVETHLTAATAQPETAAA